MEKSNFFKKSTKVGRSLERQKKGWNVMLRKIKKLTKRSLKSWSRK